MRHPTLFTQISKSGLRVCLKLLKQKERVHKSTSREVLRSLALGQHEVGTSFLERHTGSFLLALGVSNKNSADICWRQFGLDTTLKKASQDLVEERYKRLCAGASVGYLEMKGTYVCKPVRTTLNRVCPNVLLDAVRVTK